MPKITDNNHVNALIAEIEAEIELAEAFGDMDALVSLREERDALINPPSALPIALAYEYLILR